MNNFRKIYNQERVKQIDLDFLAYEEEMIDPKDLETIKTLLQKKIKIPNPHNSIILYLLNLSDEFNFSKARCDTIDGSPPDVDIDFDAQDRHKAIDWVVDNWGRDNVANIITHGTFKPKSLVRGYYRTTLKDTGTLQSDFLKKIPPPKYGKEATMDEILELNPEIKSNSNYSELLNFSSKLENMVSTFGIHAAGLVISDFPIHDVVPMWKNSKSDRITQFDKDEVENLGLIKFDFLSIDNLSIIKECVRLVKQEQNLDLDVFDIPDGDQKSYDIMNSGILCGIFQMETSGTAKKLIQEIQPQSIEDLSDISALNRPGPMQAGLDAKYIETKNNGFEDTDMPEILQEILKDSQFTLIYQEQIMAILNKMAGFTLKEADDARRAMGKKKKEVLEAYKEQFLSGSEKNGIPKKYSESLWSDIMGFADYCLHGDTKIKTKEYGYLPISEIVKNEIQATVYSLTPDNQIIEQSIKQFWDKGVKECFTYSKENIRITCTPDHKFLTSANTMVEMENVFKKNIKLKKV